MSRVKSTGAPRDYIGRLVTQQSSLQDHACNPAVSIWRYTEGSPQQPGFSYQVYVTAGYSYDDATSTLPAELIAALTGHHFEVEMWRFDVHFLPLADAEACMEHYRREKVHRQGATMHTVPSYGAVECGHHNVLSMMDDERWKETGLEMIQFDKIDIEDDPDNALGILEQEAHREPTVEGVATVMLNMWNGCTLRQEYEPICYIDRDSTTSDCSSLPPIGGELK